MPSSSADWSPVNLKPPGNSLHREPTAVDRMTALQDAKVDDWDTEELSEAAAGQLAELQRLFVAAEQLRLRKIAPLVDEALVFQKLAPGSLSAVYHDGRITVLRPEATSSDLTLVGADDFTSELKQLVSALGPGENLRAKFKVFRISKQPDHFLTRLRYEASNHDAREGRQQTAIWTGKWSLPESSGQPPRLTQITVEDYEEVRIKIPGGVLFVDCTRSALGSNSSYAQQVLPGINHWLTRIPKEFMGQLGHHGIAVGDVNGDQLDDVYVCDAGGLPNRLYVQQPDGTAIETSAESGVNFLEDSVAALLIDLDNDGDQDLVVGTDPVLQLAENNGLGTFTLRDRLEIDTDSFSLSAADYDVDGDLDIYVCGYDVGKSDPMNRGLPFPLPYHDANNGGRNVLLRNDGDFQFFDVTRQVGLDQNNTRFSMAASWEDFDNDGDLDLYVANDFGRNNLYRNNGGHFTDIAAAAKVEDHASGMSVSWGDYNRDGWMDLYVGNMFSAAGNRVTYQQRFSEGIPGRTVNHLRRMARGNSLFRNMGQSNRAVFHDVSEQATVNMGRWAWASKFVDLTNDGWQDLIVANGYVTGEDPEDL